MADDALHDRLHAGQAAFSSASARCAGSKARRGAVPVSAAERVGAWPPNSWSPLYLKRRRAYPLPDRRDRVRGRPLSQRMYTGSVTGPWARRRGPLSASRLPAAERVGVRRSRGDRESAPRRSAGRGALRRRALLSCRHGETSRFARKAATPSAEPRTLGRQAAPRCVAGTPRLLGGRSARGGARAYAGPGGGRGDSRVARPARVAGPVRNPPGGRGGVRPARIADPRDGGARAAEPEPGGQGLWLQAAALHAGPKTGRAWAGTTWGCSAGRGGPSR